MFEEKVGRRLAWSRGTRPETRFGEDVRLAWSRGRGGCVDAARRTARRWEWTASRCMVSKRKRVVLRLRQLPLCLCWVIRRTVFVANAVCCLIRIHSTTPAFDGWRMDESEPAISANFKFVPIPPRASGFRAIIWAGGVASKTGDALLDSCSPRPWSRELGLVPFRS